MDAQSVICTLPSTLCSLEDETSSGTVLQVKKFGWFSTLSSFFHTQIFILNSKTLVRRLPMINSPETPDTIRQTVDLALCLQLPGNKKKKNQKQISVVVKHQLLWDEIKAATRPQEVLGGVATRERYQCPLWHHNKVWFSHHCSKGVVNNYGLMSFLRSESDCLQTLYCWTTSLHWIFF